ncbi:3,4-dihydroxyphenylacetate 2,3-dioxygenase [Bradyrhizobium sp. 200]|nr:3,4-dihydroxyphenylacetate 2,3-dioxygenase [Bradyrhizobium sp. 200]
MIEDVVLDPPFNVTRASHVVLATKDLQRSKEFYCNVLGLIESDATADTLYLRGYEESCHHSLVLKKSDQATCERIGFRVLTDEDLDKAKRYFDRIGIRSDWVTVPYQGKTLHFSDPIGTAIELCASMTFVPRQMHNYSTYRGGSAQRLDHYQIAGDDVLKAYHFYNQLGFRPTEYVTDQNRMWGVWMQRKGNTHDLVFTNGFGPRLHHFAYTVRDAHDLIHLCDVAGSLGYAGAAERGPGRHGMGGGALFAYLRDPDGHRVELFNTHYQAIDLEPPIQWELHDPKRTDLWGMPAVAKWFFEASEFKNVQVKSPVIPTKPRTLEDVLAVKA